MEIKKLKKFKTVDALVYGMRGVLDNVRLFFFLFLTLGLIVFSSAGVAFELIMRLPIMKKINLLPYLLKRLSACKTSKQCAPYLNYLVDAIMAHKFWIIGLCVFVFVTYAIFSLCWQRIALDVCKTGTSSISRLFTVWRPLPRVLLGSFLRFIVVLIGFCAFVIPGIVLLLRLSFFTYFILDKQVGIRESWRLSWRATRSHEWELAGMWGVFLLVAFFAGLASIIFLPVGVIALAHVYCRLSKVA